MKASDVVRAIAAATDVASALGLDVEDTSVIQDSNKLALRLQPCDVVARVAVAGRAALQAELEIGRRLAEAGSPLAIPEPRVQPDVHERDGFAVTFWTYHQQTSEEISAADYAKALERLHTGMATVDVMVPHFTDRVAEAQQLVASPGRTPRLGDSDRDLLSNTLRTQTRTIVERAAAEQLVHGEPHPGNLLNSKSGLLFIDLETCCRGPVEFDLAHVPTVVSDCYPDADQELLRECRILVLAMVAAWRFDPDDHFPNGARAGRELLRALREGPPWPTLDVVAERTGLP
jgi:Ser/Thr protein kinase RdoA (MazF antagonist)